MATTQIDAARTVRVIVRIIGRTDRYLTLTLVGDRYVSADGTIDISAARYDTGNEVHCGHMAIMVRRPYDERLETYLMAPIDLDPLTD